MEEKLSVVIPCYNSEKNIESVLNRDMQIFNDAGIHNYEFILVNDCSRDDTWNVLKQIADRYDNVMSVNLAKNCGQHGAIMAGFHYVTGDYIVVSDDDGQTQMEMVTILLKKIREGYDVVSTEWVNRGKRSFIRRMGTRLTHKLNNILMDNPENLDISIFFMARRFVIEEMKKYRYAYPYINGLILRTTHNIAVVEVDQLPRKSGTSGYSFKKLVSLWLNGFTAFSIIPLRIASFAGVISAFAGFAYGIYIIIRKLLSDNVALGWSSTNAIILFMFGITLCVLGMIGEYLGRIYMCINSSPQYIVKETLGVKQGE